MIEFLNLGECNRVYRDDLMEAAARVIDSGWYIRGQEVRQFESEFADFCGVENVVGVANGLDALSLVLRGWKELNLLEAGDEIVVPANTYIATILAITENDLIPILVEPDTDTFNMSAEGLRGAITAKTRAVIPISSLRPNGAHE